MTKKLSRYKRFTCTDEDYKEKIAVQEYNGNGFREHFLGSRKKILVYDKMIGTIASENNINLGKIPKRKFVAFLGRFQKQLYKCFRTAELMYDKDIKFDKPSRGKNTALWEEMHVGKYFYNLDIKKAYWQIGYKIGYVNHELFKDYIDNDLFKPALRVCFSFLARKNYMVYHGTHDQKGKRINGGIYTITCEMDVLKKVYSNVRNQLYQEIDDIKSGLNTVVEWNIDGFSVHANELDEAIRRFKASGLEFKVVECRKLDENTYSYGKDKVKNFKIVRSK